VSPCPRQLKPSRYPLGLMGMHWTHPDFVVSGVLLGSSSYTYGYCHYTHIHLPEAHAWPCCICHKCLSILCPSACRVGW
jgi:hypothetical protein